MKSIALIVGYLIVYIVAYVLIQRKFQFKNVIAQLLLAVGLFIAFEGGYALIKVVRMYAGGTLSAPTFSHFELDSILPSALNPADTGFTENMGQNKNRLERKVDFIPQYSIDSPSNTVLICCYGGSSTYCIGMRTPTTWASVLQKRLTDSGYHVIVHNHGISGHAIKDAYTNIQHYPCKDAGSYKKHIQLHFHGWNDMRLLHLPFINNDDTSFTKAIEWHIETNKLMTGLMTVIPKSNLYNFYYCRAQDMVSFKNQINIINKTLVINYLYNKVYNKKMADLQKSFEEKMLTVADSNKPETQTLRQHFRNYFSKYVNEIDAFVKKNGKPGDAVLFIPQTLNYPMLEAEKKQTFSYWMPGISEQFACLLTRDIKTELSKIYPEHATMYNQVQSGWDKDDFLDNGHFSEKGCIKFVDKIYPDVSGLVH